MDFSSARSERITAIVSTVVAVIILAGGVTAYQSHNAPVDDLVQLESDLRFQLEFAFRHNPNERVQRLEQLMQVSEAWQQSPRQPADRELLADWLLEATIRSMPGSIEELPAVPRFGEQPKPKATKQMPEVRVEPTVEAERADIISKVPTPAPPVAAVAAQPTVKKSTKPTNAPVTVAPQPLVAMTETAQPVRINLTELSARIAGYHNGLNEVETKLRDLKSDDLQALAALVSELDGMTRDYQFAKLYYDLLTDRERRAVAAPRSMAATLAEIERRIDRSQSAQPDDFLGEFDANSQDQLAKLRSQLSAVAQSVR